MGYLDRIDGYRDDIIRDLQGLIAIPVSPTPWAICLSEKKSTKPLNTCWISEKKAGFETLNVDNYGGHIEFGYLTDEEGNPAGHWTKPWNLTHLDVVPAGSDWDYPPFSGQVVDGRLIGRGAIDNKGPTIAAFYALKALKEEGFMPRSG